MRLTAVLLVLASVLCLSATASAEEMTKRVDAEMVFEERNPRPSSCFVVAFVQWKDQPGKELRATAFYTSGRGDESKSKEQPFDDEYRDIRAPSGYHRIAVGERGKSHGDPTVQVECSEQDAYIKQEYPDRDPFVEVTIEADWVSCRTVVNPYAGTRYEGSNLHHIRALGVSCRTARYVARRATRKALGMTPPADGVREYYWRRWFVVGDIRGQTDYYRARRGSDRVRWRF